jgi:hypothetical protein
MATSINNTVLCKRNPVYFIKVEKIMSKKIIPFIFFTRPISPQALTGSPLNNIMKMIPAVNLKEEDSAMFNKLSLAVILTLLSSLTFAQQIPGLNTVTGNELGLTISNYFYKEPSIGVDIKGQNKAGVAYTGTLAFGGNWFAKADLRYVNGKTNYSGSGTAIGDPDWYYDARGLFGKDFIVSGQVVAPYAGYGYRYLFNDGRGITSTGAGGYRRESNYWYIPIGINHKMHLSSHSKLDTTIEYNYLLDGKQVSHLSDVAGYSDVKNKQNKGYGYRVSSMYVENNWALGPYFYYWSIDQSNMVDSIVVSGGVENKITLYEPKNNTKELGFKVSYKF